ncbi:MAG: hypothetical protein JWN48_4772 [Myxococcaceae bacterium]|nr:hypothetical protein [Myxococcaceae bacterium]
MSEPLDEQLARKLRRAADAADAATEQAPLGQAAQARVLAAMLQESQRLARRRRLRGVALGGLALAASAALGLWLHDAPSSPPPATLCALPVSSATRFVASEGRQLLTLGAFGRVAASADAELKLGTANPCELVITLARGTLAAELHNLRPAKLSVRTPLGEVQVRGTTFSVQVDERLQVALLHGAVELASEGQVTRLEPGQVLQRSARAPRPALRAASALDAQRIALLINPPVQAPPVADAVPLPQPVPTASVPAETRRELPRKESSSALLARAEAARRSGQLDDARSLYRQAGARRDADAEVALLRWCRLELNAGQADAAREVLQLYRQQFVRGRLRAEASSLELGALEALGRRDEARAVARELIRRFPGSPYAKEARGALPP